MLHGGSQTRPSEHKSRTVYLQFSTNVALIVKLILPSFRSKWWLRVFCYGILVASERQTSESAQREWAPQRQGRCLLCSLFSPNWCTFPSSNCQFGFSLLHSHTHAHAPYTHTQNTSVFCLHKVSHHHWAAISAPEWGQSNFGCHILEITFLSIF